MELYYGANWCESKGWITVQSTDDYASMPSWDFSHGPNVPCKVFVGVLQGFADAIIKSKYPLGSE
jgi:hypothetical protein